MNCPDTETHCHNGSDHCPECGCEQYESDDCGHETHCHCGAAYNGSDHCPECGCEQYESYNCGHDHAMAERRKRFHERRREARAASVASVAPLTVGERIQVRYEERWYTSQIIKICNGGNLIEVRNPFAQDPLATIRVSVHEIRRPRSQT